MLEINNLSAAYVNKNIFSNLTFTLPENKVIALCGMNGSGKSTLLSLMAGIVPLNLNKSGEVFVNGSSVFKNSPKQNAEKISLLVQNEFNIWDITVEQLVSDGRFIHKKWFSNTELKDKEIVENAISSLGLTELKKRNIKSLSGGEFQRARIARSLVQETPYIFLDEPLQALDINHQKELMELLKLLSSKGKTICLSIHDINIASIYADTIIMLKKNHSGFVMGTPDQLMKEDILDQTFGSGFKIYTHPVTGAKQIF